ncbi:DUF397 domain-containing protein [Streptomyces sp. NPDC014894]|uniref:DUF397 domain-containing protein n=1 Tax=Streptomyces sp. NPDC014894 TaxID=3364931 RepID=UPI0036F8223C
MTTTPPAKPTWFTSSYSNDTGGECVEIAPLTNGIAIRDSKDQQGPALTVPTPAWRAFLTYATTTA